LPGFVTFRAIGHSIDDTHFAGNKLKQMIYLSTELVALAAIPGLMVSLRRAKKKVSEINCLMIAGNFTWGNLVLKHKIVF
jgi:hypothetical protein